MPISRIFDERQTQPAKFCLLSWSEMSFYVILALKRAQCSVFLLSWCEVVCAFGRWCMEQEEETKHTKRGAEDRMY